MCDIFPSLRPNTHINREGKRYTHTHTHNNSLTTPHRTDTFLPFKMLIIKKKPAGSKHTVIYRACHVCEKEVDNDRASSRGWNWESGAYQCLSLPSISFGEICVDGADKSCSSPRHGLQYKNTLSLMQGNLKLNEHQSFSRSIYSVSELRLS